MNDASDAKLNLERDMKNFIAGEWVDSKERIEVTNPYTNEVVGSVPKMSLAQVQKAIDALYAYEPTLTAYERSEILRATAAEITKRKDELSYGISLESGMSLADSSKEVSRGVGLILTAAEEAKRIMGEQLPSDVDASGADKIILALRHPVGVVSAIVPFNRPMNQVVVKVAPAFAAGNRVIIKPTERTPMSAIRFVQILLNNGMPPEMISVVTGKSSEIGNELVSSKKIDMVTFTGSTEVGRKLTNMAGIKKLTMELGGNDPLIVMEDADLDRAADLAVAGATKNSGQRCTAVKRILVVDKIADAFVERVLAKARKLKAGNPLDPETDVGTVIHERAATLFQNRVSEAVANHGARLLHGNDRKGALFPPTVVDHVDPACELVREETFGPAIPIIRVRDIDHAIKVSNGTAYGLSSGVCTDRLDYITRFVDELQVGTVNIWEVPGYRIEMSPFGGIKDSGLGYKEGVLEAMKSFTNVKTWSLPWPG